MLTAAVDTYLAARRSVGFKLCDHEGIDDRAAGADREDPDAPRSAAAVATENPRRRPRTLLDGRIYTFAFVSLVVIGEPVPSRGDEPASTR
jgi:hypothetical protein